MASQNERRSIEWINELAVQSPQELVALSEQLYREQIERAAQGIAAGQGEFTVLLVSGPSASTKTTTSLKLSQRLEELGIRSVVISLDDFFVDRRTLPRLPNGDTDFESIATVDLPELDRCLGKLLADREADFPIFDFPQGRPSAQRRHISIGEGSLMIMEGIHALNPAITGKQDPSDFRRVYISPNSDYYLREERILKARLIRLTRRIVRDFFHRGNPVENTLRMWGNVVDSEKVNILPFKKEADFIIDSTVLYEPAIYGYWLDRILDQSVIGEQYLPRLQELISALDRFHPLSPDLVPADTVLREFLR